MSAFNSLASALHLLGKSIDPNSITKVVMTFEHVPSDLIGVLEGEWHLQVILTGTKGLSEEGVQLGYTREFGGSGMTEEVAFKEVANLVKGEIKNFLHLREEETKFAEQAMMTVCSEQNPDLASMWPSTDASGTVEPSSET
jgi:hypothetical protein